jgi:CheY-like chemotaxis protein
VLLNLAVNARDAMPRGGTLTLRTRHVTVGARTATHHPGLRAGTYVALCVSDTGHGMDAATQSRMFEPFFTTKPAGKGTGLGLATVYGIVKQSGGYIMVESAPGEGSTFTVLLPPHEGEVTEAPQRRVRALAQGSGTVLVVEDDLAVRTLVRRMLERGGYTVVEAQHGAAALELLEREPQRIDLLLTDAVMPVMGARELLAALRRRWPELPALVMTGYSDDAVELQEAVAEGMGLISKPFTTDELLGWVAGALRPRD